jgi:hypothetical protein
MNAIILNTFFYPIPRTHYLHVLKFFDGFRQNGFNVFEINDINDLPSYLNATTYVYVSAHFLRERDRFLPINLDEKLYNHVRKSSLKWLLWGFHDSVLREDYANLNNVIFLRESFDNSWMEQEERLKFYSAVNSYVLRYSSNKDPRLEYTSKKRIEGGFYAGSKYKMSFNERVQSVYPNSKILYYPPKINEILRVNGFGGMTFNLVWHSDANIEKGIIVERFAEALSYGGMIIHDHPEIVNRFSMFDHTFVSTETELLEVLMELSFSELIIESNYNLWRASELSYYKQVKNIINEL